MKTKEKKETKECTGKGKERGNKRSRKDEGRKRGRMGNLLA